MGNSELLDDIKVTAPRTRRKLLPLWIKVFIWFFFIFSSLNLLAIIYSFFGESLNLSIYGLTANSLFSISGGLLLIISMIKGLVSYGLWFEKDWGVKIAIADSLIGIFFCVIMMAILPFIGEKGEFFFEFRLELIALLPYYYKMKDIEKLWDNITIK